MTISNRAIIIAKKKGYIAIDGEIFFKNRKRKLRVSKGGYYFFSVRTSKIKIDSILVSRFVAYQKFGNKIFKKGIQVRHLDSNNKNNFDYNIAIGTPSQNHMDKSPETRMRCALIASSFSKKHNHEEIVKLHDEGKSYSQIMKKLNISSKGTISFIIKQSIASKKELE